MVDEQSDREPDAPDTGSPEAEDNSVLVSGHDSSMDAATGRSATNGGHQQTVPDRETPARNGLSWFRLRNLKGRLSFTVAVGVLSLVAAYASFGRDLTGFEIGQSSQDDFSHPAPNNRFR